VVLSLKNHRDNFTCYNGAGS